jgi:hypothetical protein
MTRLPHYQRAEEPPPMVFTPRDREVLEAIYQCEGVLADYQLARLFFHSMRRMKARMSLLYHNGYVDRFTRQQRNSYSFMAYFLGEQGVDYLASMRGILPDELNARARDERTSLIRHDVRLNDVRIAVMEAVEGLAGASLVEWVNSRMFWKDSDQIEYTDRRGKQRMRLLRPDGYFHVQLGERRHRRMLLELDMRTEHNKRFVDEKVLPGIAYIESDSYRERFGVNAGNWLVVTTGEQRVEHMVRQAEAIEDEKLRRQAKTFYYTTFEAATAPGAFFTKPIWRQVGGETPTALLEHP